MKQFELLLPLRNAITAHNTQLAESTRRHSDELYIEQANLTAELDELLAFKPVDHLLSKATPKTISKNTHRIIDIQELLIVYEEGINQLRASESAILKPLNQIVGKVSLFTTSIINAKEFILSFMADNPGQQVPPIEIRSYKANLEALNREFIALNQIFKCSHITDVIHAELNNINSPSTMEEICQA